MSEHRTFVPSTIAFPIADRQRSHRFYGAGLGFETPGEPAGDGVPEPLRVLVNDRLCLMLIPTGGFGWVTAGADVAAAGTVECQLGVTAPDAAGVDAVMATARAAGATILSEAGQQEWGYCGVFADPDGHQWMILAAPTP
jgi:predicted lactoylglutathione lyase